ncbi:protein NO VEIN domain-containing protein [Alloiococcus sp. CFN-8]|uniref:protein NO VEIN domain-containing protein n=1 Tax=Alloiococcus sp. CFN-8 TaxID=3416081 RepID=UPI003CF3B43C
MIGITSGIVAETLLLLRTLKILNCSKLHEILQLRIGYGINNKACIYFAEQSKWISIEKKEISLTERGILILSEFIRDSLDNNLWRRILYDYIKDCSPIWSKRIPYGRKEAFIFMTPDEKRCFIDAGLMSENISSKEIEWWDRTAEYIRGIHHLSLDATGRAGERLTLIYEENRIGRAPKWESFETNLSGYDIISCVSPFSSDQLLIEVKSSTRDIHHASMILSRNEWETATKLRKNSRYKFYLWLLGKEHRLAIIGVEDVKPHIPSDNGGGIWRELEIKFDSFNNVVWESINYQKEHILV